MFCTSRCVLPWDACPFQLSYDALTCRSVMRLSSTSRRYFFSRRLMLFLLSSLIFRITLPVGVRYEWKPKKSSPCASGNICVFWFNRSPSGSMNSSILASHASSWRLSS